jgi:hypothetical protein
VYKLYLTNPRLRTSGLEISETSVSHLVFVLIHSFLQNRWLGNCQILMLLIHECLPNSLLTVTENVLCFCCGVNFVQPNCSVSVECVMWFRSVSVQHISLREWNRNKAFICMKHTNIYINKHKIWWFMELLLLLRKYCIRFSKFASKLGGCFIIAHKIWHDSEYSRCYCIWFGCVNKGRYKVIYIILFIRFYYCCADGSFQVR